MPQKPPAGKREEPIGRSPGGLWNPGVIEKNGRTCYQIVENARLGRIGQRPGGGGTDAGHPGHSLILACFVLKAVFSQPVGRPMDA